ncbi:MAG: BamA/TamA family outer membrane protein [candidate division Zixibacteria bacterium]
MIKSTFCSLLFLCGSVEAVMFTDPPESDTALTADTVANEENKLLVIPFVFYSPETKLAVGIYPSYLFRIAPGCRPSSISLPMFYTTNKQFAVNLEFGITLPENRHNFAGNIYFEKWPNVFYGIGGDASADNIDDYTSRNAGIYLSYKRRYVSSLYYGVDFSLFNRKYTVYPESGRFTTSEIIGSVSGRQTGFGFSITWDDRDNILYPGDGYYGAVSVGYNGDKLGSDYDFKSYSVDLRKYMTVRDTDTFSLWTVIVAIDGDPPFWAMPRIGDYIRGYEPMRHIDRGLLAFQVEYRIHPIWKRLGIAFFAGTGAVEKRIANIASDDFHTAAGFGIRYLLLPGEKLNIRIDFGIGGESTELYIEAGEAF